MAGWEVFHENGGFNGKIHENHLDQWVVVVPYVWLPEVSPFKMKNFDEENMEKCNYIMSLTMINHQFLGGFPGDLEDTSQLDASHEYMPGGRN